VNEGIVHHRAEIDGLVRGSIEAVLGKYVCQVVFDGGFGMVVVDDIADLVERRLGKVHETTINGPRGLDGGESEASNDAKVVVAALECPMKISIAGGAGFDNGPVSKDHFVAQDIVNGKPVSVVKERETSADTESEANFLVASNDGGKVIGVQCSVDIAKAVTRANLNVAFVKIGFPHI